MPRSWVDTEYSIHRVQYTPSTAYTMYSIHQVQHTPSMAYTKYGIHRVWHTPSMAYTEYGIHRVWHTPSMAYTEYGIHRVWHTPSMAYTEYGLHWVQHTPSTASSQDCLSSFHSHDYEVTPDGSFNFRRPSLHDWPPSASSPWELKGNVTLSHSHICESTNWWIESQHLAHRPSTGSKYSSNLAWSRPPKCISKLAWSWPPSVSQNSLDYGLQVRTIIASKCISKPAQLWPPSASPNSLDWGLQVHPQTRSIAISGWISKLTRLQCQSVCAKTLDYRL